MQVNDLAQLTPAERAWLARTAKKQRRAAGQTSKYVRHQGMRERTRRMKAMEASR